MNDINLKLVIAMARSYNTLFSRIAENVRGYGLTLSEFGVLEMLYHKGPQPVQKIAEKILVTSGTITYVINKLLEKGFVNRMKCDNDKRIYYVSLTPAGERLITEIFPKHRKFLDHLLKEMHIREKESFIHQLMILQDTVDPTRID